MTAIAQVLSTALLDFVWQGLLVALLLWMTLFALKNRSARARYAASCFALATMAALPVVTACVIYASSAGPAPGAPWISLASHSVAAASPAQGVQAFDWAGWLARWALPAWSAGVLLFSLRLIWASRQVSALRRHANPAEGFILAMVSGLGERLRLTRPVRVLVSAAADCPSVVGWFKPALLLPAATVAGLTPQQLEAVLAHELAHILRYDYLVNMLQTVVETLLFYHPAVWWASARIRQERELCCDDVAVESCGDAICYARALTRLERLRVNAPAMTLSSAGGPLMYRIQRLTGDPRGQGALSKPPAKLPGILALSLGLVCFAFNMQRAHGQEHPAPAPQPAAHDDIMASDDGVRVDLRGAAIIHRDDVEYPEAALEKHVQGTVTIEATLDAEGAVSDARVLSGPSELRKAALQSVLQWHFKPDAAAGDTRQVAIDFAMPAEGRALLEAQREQNSVDLLVRKELAAQMAEQARKLQGIGSIDASKLEAEAKQLRDMMKKQSADLTSSQLAELLEQQDSLRKLGLDSELAARKSQLDDMQKLMAEMKERSATFQRDAMFAGRRVKSIRVQGLSAESRDALLATLPVHPGDNFDEEAFDKVESAAKRFDEHLGVSLSTSRDGQVEIRISRER